MKVIIAGSRDIKDNNLLLSAIKESKFNITEIVSGCCRGIDWLGELYAYDNKLSLKKFPADWKQLGKFAGISRNKEMANYADALIAIWDGESYGTKNMIEEAKSKGLKIFIKESK